VRGQECPVLTVTIPCTGTTRPQSRKKMSNCLSFCLSVVILIALFACCCLPILAVMGACGLWG
jgi:hypothetical protein